MNENDMSRRTRQRIRFLTPEQQERFEMELEARRKDVRNGYLWWFALGSHYGYLERWQMQALFWITLGGLGVWWFADIWRMEKMVLAYNRSLSEWILDAVTALPE